MTRILRNLLTLATLLSVGGGVSQTAVAQLTWGDVLGFRPPAETPVYTRERLAKTKADECFAGIGVDYPPFNSDGSCSAGVPKANQAYVWGLTQAGLNTPAFAGDDIWFGTMANPLCDAAAGVQHVRSVGAGNRLAVRQVVN